MCTTRTAHPPADDLYDYFSRIGPVPLTPEQRISIAYHLLMCDQCNGLGNDFIEFEAAWNNIDTDVDPRRAVESADESYQRFLKKLADG